MKSKHSFDETMTLKIGLLQFLQTHINSSHQVPAEVSPAKPLLSQEKDSIKSVTQPLSPQG